MCNIMMFEQSFKGASPVRLSVHVPAPPLQDVDLKKTVDESARIQRAYSHYFDLTIVNDNLDKAFETLQAAVDKLCSESQWVPVNWVF